MAGDGIAGSRLLGTSSAGGQDFYMRKALMVSDALNAAFARASQEQAKRDQEEQRQIEEFYKIALQDPEMASAMGPAIKAQYGDKYPTLGAAVDFLNNKGRNLAQIQAAGQKYYDHLQAVQDKYAQDQQNLASMPDTIPVPAPHLVPSVDPQTGLPRSEMQFLPVDAPNPEKIGVQQRLSKMEPALFPYIALAGMTPEEQAQARASGAVVGATPIDPGKMPAAMQAGFLATLDAITGDDAVAARVGQKVVQSPAELQKQRAQAAARQEVFANERSRDLTRKNLMEEQARLRNQQIQNQAAAQRQNIDYRHGKRMEEIGATGGGGTAGGGVPAKLLGGGKGSLGDIALTQSQQLMKQWSEQKDAAAPSGLPTEVRSGLVTRYQQDNPAPVPLSPAGARTLHTTIANIVRQGKITDPNDAIDLTTKAVAYYTQLTQGIGPDGKPILDKTGKRAPLSSAAALATVVRGLQQSSKLQSAAPPVQVGPPVMPTSSRGEDMTGGEPDEFDQENDDDEDDPFGLGHQ